MTELLNLKKFANMMRFLHQNFLNKNMFKFGLKFCDILLKLYH